MGANGVFIIVFIVFVAFLFGASFISKNWVSDSSDYILAGREISTPINVFGVIAIGFAGTTITLAPGFTVQFGLLGGIGWGLIYSMCGLLLFGLLFPRFIHRSGAQTLPEFLEMRYDAKTRSVVAITSIVGMCGVMANNIVSSVQNIAAYTGWNTVFITALIFAVIIAFTYISGMWAVSMTDFVQVILGIVVVPMVMILVMQHNGSWDVMLAHWPTDHIWNQGLVGNMPGMKITYPSIFNFIICFAAALVWGNNYYWMKVANCRSEKVARKSFVIAAIILFVVFMIPLAIVGAYVGAFHGDVLTINGGTIEPTGAYGYIASTLIPIFGSLAVIGAVAASVSTSATSSLGASAIMTRDIYQRIRPDASPSKTLRFSKIAMIIVGVLTFVLCQFPGGPTYLFAFANCWLVPPAILLGLGAVWKKFNKRGAFVGAICGMVTMFVFTLLDLTGVFHVGNYVYLATLGFVVTLVAAVIASLTEKPKYFGEAGWELDPTDTNREEITLEERDMEILRLMRIGHKYMRDFSDYMGTDSKITNESIERLDKGGYIARLGLSGAKMYTFRLTEKGLQALAPAEGREKEMLSDGLTPMYTDFLNMIIDKPDASNDFAKKYEVRSMQLAAITAYLAEKGYLLEKGAFKRRLYLTDAGKQMAKKYA